jgi:hypothetical protein
MTAMEDSEFGSERVVGELGSALFPLLERGFWIADLGRRTVEVMATFGSSPAAAHWDGIFSGKKERSGD